MITETCCASMLAVVLTAGLAWPTTGAEQPSTTDERASAGGEFTTPAAIARHFPRLPGVYYKTGRGHAHRGHVDRADSIPRPPAWHPAFAITRNWTYLEASNPVIDDWKFAIPPKITSITRQRIGGGHKFDNFTVRFRAQYKSYLLTGIRNFHYEYDFVYENGYYFLSFSETTISYRDRTLASYSKDLSHGLATGGVVHANCAFSDYGLDEVEARGGLD